MPENAKKKNDVSFLGVLNLNSASLAESPMSRKKIDYTLLVSNKESHYSMNDILELARGIEMVGLIHDLVVKPIPESDRFVITSGHRRLAAIKMLVEEQGKDKFREPYCQISSSDEDDTITKIKVHVANMQREKTEYDKMMAIQRLEDLIAEAREKGIKVTGKARDLISNTIGLSPRQVQTYMTVSRSADEETAGALQKGNITLTQAFEKTKNKGKEKVAVTATTKAPNEEENTKKVYVFSALKKVDVLKRESVKLEDLMLDTLIEKVIKRLNELLK